MPSRHLLFTHHQEHQHKTTLTFIFISITIFSSLLILLAISYLIYNFGYSLIQILSKRLNKRIIRTSPLDSNPHITKLRRFTYKELISATNSFSRENHIGKGGSCTVFRGILKSGKLVAVKVLESDTSDSEREFSNELKILSSFENSRSQFVVSLLGYCIHKQRKLVVYEYMPNKSLQESLFGNNNNKVLSWSRRFEIVRDVSYGLEFLHLECDPPVIHGDVKPSNVLLDTDFRAKISDFGLSRLKVDEQDFGVDMFSQDLSGAGTGAGAVESPVIGTPIENSSNEVDFAVALQASSSSTPMNVKLGLGALNHKGKDVSNIENGNGNGDDWNDKKFTNYDANDEELGHDFDKDQISCTDGLNNRVSKKQWGKDWWWKQEGSGELCSKDYVQEWIGSQISPSANADWDDDKNSERPDFVNNKAMENDEPREWKRHRKMEEWWKDEQLDELETKKVKKKTKRRFRLSMFKRTRKQKARGHENGLDTTNDQFSFKKQENGDVFSRELSSTTSMRGTLCYVAPEYGGCGYLMEKADIYSFGVLILVIVSGRRPLHVLASPMKLEKANLISWCRQLAQGGDLLELVDERLKGDYNKTQASLCVNLALACLQKMPELRPDIGDIVKVLNGEMDLPVLPYEFSPSPPSKWVGKSRSKRRSKNNGD